MAEKKWDNARDGQKWKGENAGLEKPGKRLQTAGLKTLDEAAAMLDVYQDSRKISQVSWKFVTIS